MATTFYFGGVNITSTTVATSGANIIVSNIYRPLKKNLTRHKVEIPGRFGSWDFGGGGGRDYTIKVGLIITANTAAQVMTCVDSLDYALRGKESLIFSDSTTKTHQAQVFSAVMLTPEGSGNVVRATINFECDAEDFDVVTSAPTAVATAAGNTPSVVT